MSQAIRAMARTALRPEQGYSDWMKEAGWWLDRRILSVGAGKV